MSIDWSVLDRCGPATLRRATVLARALPPHVRGPADQNAAGLRDLCDQLGVSITDPATVAAIALGMQLCAGVIAGVALTVGPVGPREITGYGHGVLAGLVDHVPAEATR